MYYFHTTFVMKCKASIYYNANKKHFIEMLIEQLQAANIATKQAKDDADVLIIETAMEVSEKERTAIIIGEDIDLLVLLIGRTQSHHRQIFLKKIGKGTTSTLIYSSKSLDKYRLCKEHILFLHALTGCDTTSALFNKGKLKVMTMFEKHPDLTHSAQIFQAENCPPDTVFQNGKRFLLAMYGAPKDEVNLDKFRYTQFIKATRLNRPVKLSSLPPTSEAARQHIYRVYYQVQIWLGKNLQPEEWGWDLKNDILQPKTTLLPPAPDELLNTIFCNCKKGCGAQCGCRKVGLPCSKVCGQCHGQACLNPSTELQNIEDFSDLEPEEVLPTDIEPTDIEEASDEDNVLIEVLVEPDEDEEEGKET